jgi:hypothetical protein
MRPKIHPSNAARQRAYRARKRAGLVRPKKVLSLAESIAEIGARELKKYLDEHPGYK